MGCQRLMVLTTTLLFAKDLGVSAQYASVVECLPQATATIARPVVQTSPFVLPAVIQPIITSYDAYAPDIGPGYGNSYGNLPAPFPGPLPPIIIEDDKDTWQQLLYFLIFALSNKRSCAYNTPPSYGSGCSCNCGCRSSGNCNCGCSCGCSSSNNNKDNNIVSAPTYIPIPIAIPIFTNSDCGYPYIDADSEDIIIQAPSGQGGNGREQNEISFIIRTD